MDLTLRQKAAFGAAVLFGKKFTLTGQRAEETGRELRSGGDGNG